MVHQHFALVPAMTVAENIALGGQGLFNHSRTAATVRELGERTGLRVDPYALAGELPIAAQQRVEILKALTRDARLLILDEPSAMLSPEESAELWRWLRRFVAGGNTVALVTHKLREALAIADDVTVLRRGTTILATAAADTNEDALVRAMIGEPIRDAAVGAAVGTASPAAPAPGSVVQGAAEGYRSAEKGSGQTDVDASAQPAGEAAPRLAGEVVISAESLTLRTESGAVAIRDAAFTVHAGEIVGVAAVEGAGQRELLKALAGRLPPESGVLRIPASVGYVPEDRTRDALIADFSLTENVALAASGRARGRTPWHALEVHTAALLTEYDIRAQATSVIARTLSGGNQQKLVLAREFSAAGSDDGGDDGSAVVLDNPTRGLDVVAAAAVYRRLRAARAAGIAVVFYSGDLDEVLSLADRVLVVHAGEVRELPADRNSVGKAMVGA